MLSPFVNFLVEAFIVGILGGITLFVTVLLIKEIKKCLG